VAGYAALRKHLVAAGVVPACVSARPLRVYDPVQQLAIVDPEVLAAFGVDVIELGRAFSLADSDWVDWELPSASHAPCQMPCWAAPRPAADDTGAWVLCSPRTGRELGRMVAGGLYFEQTHFPWADTREHDRTVASYTPDAVAAAAAETMWGAFPSPPGPDVSAAELEAGARRLRGESDRAITAIFGGSLFETGPFVVRHDNFLAMLAGDRVRAERFLDALVAAHEAALDRFLGAVGPSVDVVLFGDDLGETRGPLISPKMYREIFKPRHARLW
jgi:uroporphyrinogen decarboxylase